MYDRPLEFYTDKIIGQYRQKLRFIAMLKAVNAPIVDCFNFLSNLNEQFDIDTAIDPYLETLARWVDAPLIIPSAEQLAYFGFFEQEKAMSFGELGSPDIGGYFRESGQSGTGGFLPRGELLQRLIKAKILKNNSTGNIEDTKEILRLVLDHALFSVTDNHNMTITFKTKTIITSTQKILIQTLIPLPTGVQLIIAS